jgi:major membrane immunogen (membrane-anchored lipoprotein)
MKKLLIVPLLVMISLLLTACTSKTTEKGTSTDNKDEATATTQNDGEENIKGSILDLAKMGKNVKCTYKFDNEEAAMEGTVYVSGSKTRSDIKIKISDGTENDSTTITDGEWMYMWSTAAEQGTKMNIKDMEQMAEKYKTEGDAEEDSNNQYKNQTQDVDYKCRPWVVDNSKFNIPTNIEFIDMNEMMKGLLEMSERLQNQQ